MFRANCSDVPSAQAYPATARPGKSRWDIESSAMIRHNFRHNRVNGYLFPAHHTSEASTMPSSSYRGYGKAIPAGSRYKDYGLNSPSNKYPIPYCDYIFSRRFLFRTYRCRSLRKKTRFFAEKTKPALWSTSPFREARHYLSVVHTGINRLQNEGN
ncbi:hypothetical protein SDC9_149893 [bioreactor metagenome]|uniref:Uncharacterized protein n=1 Tax=bioreactor metagenome TaxID=1076179 RepID=A0A645ELM3_9ZZZZ